MQSQRRSICQERDSVMNALLEKYKNLPVEVKASGWYMICNVVQNALGFITLPIFSRILTTEEYGLYSVYLTWMNMLVIFTNLNLQFGVFNTAMIRFEKERDRFISAMQGLTTVLSLAWLVIYVVASDLWNKLFQLPTFIMIVMAFEMMFFPAKDYWSGKLRFDYKYKATVIYTLALAVINPLVCIIAIFGADGDKGIVRIIAAAAVNMVFYLAIYIRNFKKGKVFFHKEYWKYALEFGIPLVTYYISQMIFNQSDKLMIQHMEGLDKAGIYSLVYSCSVVVVFIINAINGAYVPWKYKKIQEKAYQDVAKVSELIAMAIGVILVLVILGGPELVKILASEEYYEAIWIMPPVIGSLFFLFLAQLFINIEFYFEEKQALVKGSVFSAVLNIVLNYFAIKQWGYIAAGYTTLIAYIVFAVANYYYMKKMCESKLEGNVIYDMKHLVIMSIAFLIIMLLALVVYPYPLIRWGVLVVIGIVVLAKAKNILLFFKGVLTNE